MAIPPLPCSLTRLAPLFLQPSDKEMFSRSVTSLATDAPPSSEQNGALTNGDSKCCHSSSCGQASLPAKGLEM